MALVPFATAQCFDSEAVVLDLSVLQAAASLDPPRPKLPPRVVLLNISGREKLAGWIGGLLCYGPAPPDGFWAFRSARATLRFLRKRHNSSHRGGPVARRCGGRAAAAVAAVAERAQQTGAGRAA